MSKKSIISSNSAINEQNSDLPEKTPDETPKYLGLSGPKLNTAITFLAGAGFLLFGYDQGVMGSLLTLKSFRTTFPEMDAMDDSSKSTFQGFVVAIYEVGCLIGALITSCFGDTLGRRKVIFIGCITMIIGAIIQCSSYSTGQLIAGRIVTGLGNGANTATVPVWQSECAKPHVRGKLVMMSGSLIVFGIMISYWVDFGFYFVTTNSAAWRFPLAFQIIFPLVILPFILSLPESPRWLLKKGRVEEAKHVFAALDDCPMTCELISAEVERVNIGLLAEQDKNQNKSQFTQIFSQGKKKNFHRVALAVCNQMMQQICGINLITYYAGTIFEQYIHMSPLNSRILAACNGTEYFLASWIAFFTIERFGRRNLMIYGAAGQAVTMAILTGTTWAADTKNGNNSHAGVAAAVFLFVFNTFFAVGWLGMTWLYPAEITPLSIRAAANGLSTASNWAFNFMVVMITPVAFANIGSYTYTIFAVINFLMVPTVYFLYPETSGRSLEDIDKIFENSNPMTPWDVVGIEKSLPHERELADDLENMKYETNHVENVSA